MRPIPFSDPFNPPQRPLAVAAECLGPERHQLAVDHDRPILRVLPQDGAHAGAAFAAAPPARCGLDRQRMVGEAEALLRRGSSCSRVCTEHPIGHVWADLG